MSTISRVFSKELPEPALCQHNMRLLLRNRQTALHALNYTDRKSILFPKDLRNHLFRIDLCIFLGRLEDLYAAVIDLFAVLGPNGSGLKKRLYSAMKGRLKRKQIKVLRSGLKKGFTREEACKHVPFALMCEPHNQSTKFMEMQFSDDLITT